MNEENINEVWYLKYYNIPTKVKGIVVFDTKAQAEKYRADLDKWNRPTILYAFLEVVGPHEHTVPKK